jgi:ATP-dependent Clp protease ATP-binding subunit ClpX
MAMEGIDLTFTDSALRELARLALKRRTGARGLRAMLEKIMLEIMFEAPKLPKPATVRVSKSMVSGKPIAHESADGRFKIA